MKSLKLIVLSISFCFTFMVISISQTQIDTLKFYKLETLDGNSYIGKILSIQNDTIKFNTEKIGTINFPKSEVKQLKKIENEKVVEGKLWFENPQSTRYFWSPNGYGLKKGEGYYQNIWVLWNQASVGITDNFSVGVGLIPLFLFGVGDVTPMWVVPKLSIPVVRDKFNIGAGILAGTIGFQSDGGFGIAYGVGTYGNKNNNFTLGLGYGYAAGEWATKPLINIGIMARLSSHTYFLSENYFIGIGDDWVGMLSAGARSMIRKVGLDYGLFLPLGNEIDEIIALPWLGITIPFNMRF